MRRICSLSHHRRFISFLVDGTPRLSILSSNFFSNLVSSKSYTAKYYSKNSKKIEKNQHVFLLPRYSTPVKQPLSIISPSIVL